MGPFVGVLGVLLGGFSLGRGWDCVIADKDTLAFMFFYLGFLAVQDGVYLVRNSE